MDSATTAALIGAAGGSVVGLFNWLWGLYKDHQASKRIRAMLRLEIESNLRDLKKIFSEANEAVTLDRAPIGAAQRSDGLARSYLRSSEHATWDQLRPLVPSALNEIEIQNTYKFYADLSELRRLHGGLNTGNSQSRTQFENVAKCILAQGNPIP